MAVEPNFYYIGVEPNFLNFITTFTVARCVSCPQLCLITVFGRINVICLPRIVEPCTFSTNPTSDSGGSDLCGSTAVSTRILACGFLYFSPFKVM